MAHTLQVLDVSHRALSNLLFGRMGAYVVGERLDRFSDIPDREQVRFCLGPVDPGLRQIGMGNNIQCFKG